MSWLKSNSIFSTAMKFPNYIFSGVLILGLLSCNEQRAGKKSSAPEVTKSRQRSSRIIENPRPTGPTRDNSQEAIKRRTDQCMLDTSEAATTARRLAQEKGLACFTEIVSLFTGENREAAIRIAISTLMERFDRTAILKELDALPPGTVKGRTISNLISRPGDPVAIEDRMLSLIQSLEYKEDRAETIQALFGEVKIQNASELSKILSLIQDSHAFDGQKRAYYQEGFIKKYVYSLTENGGWRNVSNITSIPEKFRKQAVDQIAFSLASEDETSLASFINSVNGLEPDQQASASKVGFKVAAEKSPEGAIAQLASISHQNRAAAISGLVSGWILKDSMAASKWASNLTGSDQVAAAEVVVGYLEKRKVPTEEIAPWQAILNQSKPE